MFRLAQIYLTVVISLGLAGCGGGGGLPEGVKSGTVSGSITSSGEPLPEGCTLSFHPEGGTGIPAISSVMAGGSFKLRAKGTFDIPTGIYKVVVQPPPPPPMSDEEEMMASLEDTSQSSDIKEIPEKYRGLDTTTEMVEVKEGDNTFTIDLKP